MSGVMPDAVNDTTIILIPKVPHPKELKEFGPISLCNVMYKIMSKCLVNRLRPLLTDHISENQSAFIPGRLISNDSIIAFECIHHIQAVGGDAPALCAYKLDLSKAYACVDWELLPGMDFSDHGMHFLVKYSVKFNGKLQESFTLSCGLHQGDPLSPFLFPFVADALFALINKSMADDSLEGVRICRRASVISHILFADDSLLFFQASE